MLYCVHAILLYYTIYCSTLSCCTVECPVIQHTINWSMLHGSICTALHYTVWYAVLRHVTVYCIKSAVRLNKT